MRKLRLWSGLILFVYVATHLLNHALGLISIEAMELGRGPFAFVWAGYAGLAVLGAAIAVHVALAFWALYTRESLRMHPWEAIQLILGLLLPFILVQHVVGTIVLRLTFEAEINYTYIMLVLWILSPLDGMVQVFVVVVAWIHGCIGMHFWLRLKSFYRPVQPYALTLAVLLPVTALLGFVAAGKEIEYAAATQEQLGMIVSSLNLPSAAEVAPLIAFIDNYRYTFGGLILLTLGGRWIRHAVRRRRGTVRITYPGNRTVEVLAGTSILDASRSAGIPHASVCGGRGRCSTCRVRLGDGREAASPPDEEELRVLNRVGAPPHVRLACQLRPTDPIEVTPLLPPDATPRQAYGRPAHLAGQEREIAVLFADLRSFTKFSESKLPYDVVFVLNRYFRHMGEAIENAGGRLDKFIGDGVMALFGVAETPEEGARQALNAARNMSLQLNDLNRALQHDLEEPLRMGIGIHLGPAIVGEMGYAQAVTLTAIGDTVNTASRLEAMTKELGAQLVVSDKLAKRAGVDLSGYPSEQVAIRGRKNKLGVRVIEDASSLPL